MFRLRLRASELLYVREGGRALVDRKPFSQSDLEKKSLCFPEKTDVGFLGSRRTVPHPLTSYLYPILLQPVPRNRLPLTVRGGIPCKQDSNAPVY